MRKFLLVSHIGSRATQPSWFTDGDWERMSKVWTSILPAYCKAKWEADQLQTALAAVTKRNDPARKFQSINLRPGTLTDEPASGKVALGQVSIGERKISRRNVALVADALLAREDTHGWYDLLDGEEPVDDAVERVAKGKIDAVEGEDVDAFVKKFGL